MLPRLAQDLTRPGLHVHSANFWVTWEVMHYYSTYDNFMYLYEEMSEYSYFDRTSLKIGQTLLFMFMETQSNFFAHFFYLL